MSTKEAHDIIAQLQEYEFPAAYAKARPVALLKAGGVPTMSKFVCRHGGKTRSATPASGPLTPRSCRCVRPSHSVSGLGSTCGCGLHE